MMVRDGGLQVGVGAVLLRARRKWDEHQPEKATQDTQPAATKLQI
jgi:hypothetical protein